MLDTTVIRITQRSMVAVAVPAMELSRMTFSQGIDMLIVGAVVGIFVFCFFLFLIIKSWRVH